ATEDDSRDRTSSRSSSRSRISRTRARSPFSSLPTGPGQNTRPTTAARCSVRFSAGSSRPILVPHDEALVDQVADDLLQEERVPLGAFKHRAVYRRGQVLDLEQEADQA